MLKRVIGKKATKKRLNYPVKIIYPVKEDYPCGEEEFEFALGDLSFQHRFEKVSGHLYKSKSNGVLVCPSYS